jgi:DNA-binding response OmpR family regulator
LTNPSPSNLASSAHANLTPFEFFHCSTAMKRILLIEDDPDIQDLVRYNLGQEGFAVEAYGDGAAGLLSARRDRPDLILLDVMLPGLTGNEVCKKLKADRNTEAIPIIFLTARSDEIDKMIGFEIGADDYVSKPFSPRELAARIKAVLRRAQAPLPAETVLSFGDLQVDFEKRQVLFRQAPVVLSALEFGIFYLLASAPNRVFTRDEVLDRVWKGESYVTSEPWMFTSADCAPRLSRFPSSPTAFPHCVASGTNSNGHPEKPPVSQDHGVVRGVAAGRVGGHVRVHGLPGPRQLYST